MAEKVEAKRELYTSAQERLVASLLVEPDPIPKVLEIIDEDAVEEPKYYLIFRAMAELSRVNSKISPVTVAEALDREGQLGQVGGTAGLYTLATSGRRYLVEAPALVYARIVKENSAKSKTARVLEENLDKFKDNSPVPAADAVAEVQSFLNEVTLSLSDSSTITDFSKAHEDYKVILRERAETSKANAELAEGLQGIPSLLPTLNKYTTGWLPGQMITVGAATGVGKSVMALNCAIAAARANASVIFFSLEMGKAEIQDRVYSATTGIPMWKFKQGRLDGDDHKVLEAQMAAMTSFKLLVDDEPKHTVDSIRARALKQAQTPAGLDMVIVDYLQLITPTGRYSSRQEAVADISRNMKLLAKQLQVPVMVLVQMKRKGSSNDEESGPQGLDDIRESGAIAQDSDVVILLHRDLPTDDSIPHTLVIIAKNRNGEKDKTIHCHSNLQCSLFHEVTRVKDVEKLTEDELEDDDLTMDGLEDFDDLDEDFGDVELEDVL